MRCADVDDLARHRGHALDDAAEGRADLGVLEVQPRALLGQPRVGQAGALLEDFLAEGALIERGELEREQARVEDLARDRAARELRLQRGAVRREVGERLGLRHDRVLLGRQPRERLHVPLARLLQRERVAAR